MQINRFVGPRHSFRQEVFMDGLCRQECTIEKLHLSNTDLVRDAGSLHVRDTSNDDSPKNASLLKDLIIMIRRLDCAQATAIARRCRRLHSVDELCENHLQTISVFNNLLEKNQLHSLVIPNNEIGETDMKRIFDETNYQQLDFSGTWKCVGTLALRRNHVLGCCMIAFRETPVLNDCRCTGVKKKKKVNLTRDRNGKNNRA